MSIGLLLFARPRNPPLVARKSFRNIFFVTIFSLEFPFFLALSSRCTDTICLRVRHLRVSVAAINLIVIDSHNKNNNFQQQQSGYFLPTQNSFLSPIFFVRKFSKRLYPSTPTHTSHYTHTVFFFLSLLVQFKLSHFLPLSFSFLPPFSYLHLNYVDSSFFFLNIFHYFCSLSDSLFFSSFSFF